MNRIKELREKNKWTQTDLSIKLNSSISSIAMYEKEERKPSLEVLVKLSEIFDCSIDYLLGKSDIRNPEKIDSDKINIGLSKKDYNPPTPEQQEKIEEYARFVLQNNLKDKENK